MGIKKHVKQARKHGMHKNQMKRICLRHGIELQRKSWKEQKQTLIDFDLKKLSEGSEKEVVSRDALGQCSTTSKTKKLPSEKPKENGVGE